MANSGFRPDQEQQIAEQYLAGATLNELARAWRTSGERIRAALEATGTTLRKRGGQVGRTYLPPAALTERNERILTRAREGQTTAQLMAEFGLTRAGILHVLRDAEGLPGVRSMPVDLDPAATDRAIVERYQAGEMVITIIRTMRVSHGRVLRVLAEAGIERRAPPPPPRRTRTAADVTPHNPAPTMITTRTCHECQVTMKETDWPRHMAEIHGVVSKNQKQLSSVDRYLERIREQPEVEPQRQPEPPCDICGAEHCSTPLICGRHRRARAQHGWSGRRAA